jgi:DNA-binding MarR family transcriptional regulator
MCHVGGMSDSEAQSRASDLASELRALVSKLKRRMREQAESGDFTPSQTAVLLRLERDGAATVSNLARAEGIRPQSMGAVVAPLEEVGFIEGAPDPGDARQTLLSLSEIGRALLREGRAARQDWLSRTLSARLTPQELTEVAAAVALLKRLVEG